jgi:hypothetical protein
VDSGRSSIGRYTPNVTTGNRNPHPCKGSQGFGMGPDGLTHLPSGTCLCGVGDDVAHTVGHRCGDRTGFSARNMTAGRRRTTFRMVGDLVNLGRLVVRSRAAVRQCGDPRARSGVTRSSRCCLLLRRLAASRCPVQQHSAQPRGRRRSTPLGGDRHRLDASRPRR